MRGTDYGSAVVDERFMNLRWALIPVSHVAGLLAIALSASGSIWKVLVCALGTRVCSTPFLGDTKVNADIDHREEEWRG